MLHHVASKRKRIIAADMSWACVRALPARKRQVHNPEEAPCSDFTLQSPQIRSKFCRGRANRLGIPLGPNPCQGADTDQHRHAGESTRASYGCNAQAPARTKAARLACPLGIPLGPSTGATQGKSKGKRSHAQDPARDPAWGCHAKVSLAEAIQLAHARFSCASFGRVSQDSLHYTCQRASPTVLAVSCNGSPAVLIIEFGLRKYKERAALTPPLNA